MYSTNVHEMKPRKNSPTVVLIEREVCVTLQYRRDVAYTTKIVSGTEICVLESFSNTGFLKSVLVPLFLGGIELITGP
jgi:hypothetical protein